jgi:hypothetical protein
MLDLELLRLIRQISLPKVVSWLISEYLNDINERIKERTGSIIKQLATSRVVGDDKTLRDLIHATVNSTTEWAYNTNIDGSLMWRFSYRPTTIQCEHALLETGLDFCFCERHPRYRDCNNECRNGRNLERSGRFVRGPKVWFRCVDYWHNGRSAPHRDGWVEGSNQQ